MSALSDLLALLDRWTEWKRMREAPARVDELERRLAALETGPKVAPGRNCPACGQPAMRRTAQEERRVGHLLAGFTETWTCADCGATDKVKTSA